MEPAALHRAPHIPFPVRHHRKVGAEQPDPLERPAPEGDRRQVQRTSGREPDQKISVHQPGDGAKGVRRPPLPRTLEEHFILAEGDANLVRTGFDRLLHLAIEAVLDPVVVVQDVNEPAARRLYRRVGARIETEVRGVAEITDAAAAGFSNQPGKVARTGVVDDQDLHLSRSRILLQHRGEALLEIGPALIERNNDRPERASLRIANRPEPCERRFTALAPVNAPSVDIDDRIGDPSRVTEIVDGPAAALDAAIVVDDHETARRHFIVESGERVHRRFIHVAVEAQHRQPLDRRGVKRVLEPALEEYDAVVQESVFGEIRFHLVERNRELLVGVVNVPAIRGVGFRVGRRKSFERIGDENPPPQVPEGLERRPHQDAGAAAPGARFNQIAFYLLAEDGRDQFTQVPEPHPPDHRVGPPRPIPAVFPERGVERSFDPGRAPLRIAVAVDGVGQASLDEIEIERRRGRGGLRGGVHLWVFRGARLAPDARAARRNSQGAPPGLWGWASVGGRPGLRRFRTADARSLRLLCAKSWRINRPRHCHQGSGT